MLFKTLSFFVITVIVPNKICCSDKCESPPTKCRLDDIQCLREQEKALRQLYQSKEASSLPIENINPYRIDKIKLPLDCKRVDLINVTIYGLINSSTKLYNVVVNKNVYTYNGSFTHNICLNAKRSVLVDILTGEEVVDDCPLQIDFNNIFAWNTMDAEKVKDCNGKEYLKTFNLTSLVDGGTTDIKTGLERVKENLDQEEKCDFEKVLLDRVGNLCTQVLYNNYKTLTASSDFAELFE